MSRVVAIDPGLANTGIVLYVDGAIRAAVTCRTKPGPRDDFAEIWDRAGEMASSIVAQVVNWAPDEIVAEGYGDIPGPLRGAKGRWMCPLAMGRVFDRIEAMGLPLKWQDPETVMKAMRAVVLLWKAKKAIIEGDDALTNEHTRSAAAHGHYYIYGRRDL